jgi:HSP20 family protein
MPWRRKQPREETESEIENPVALFERDMDSMFDNFFRGFGLAPFGMEGNEWATFNPRVDIVDSDKEVKVSVELPGMDEKDVDVALARDVLTISGEKRQDKENRGKNYHRMERSYGAFTRSIPLMCTVDENKAEATFKNGVLTVTLPKTVEGQCLRTIKVKTE